MEKGEKVTEIKKETDTKRKESQNERMNECKQTNQMRYRMNSDE